MFSSEPFKYVYCVFLIFFLVLLWAGHVARMGEGRNVYTVLVGKPEGKDQLEDQGVDGIKMDLRETGCGGVEWIHLAQDRDRWRAVVNAVMNLRVLVPRSYFLVLFP
jgi:hypothetical protein